MQLYTDSICEHHTFHILPGKKNWGSLTIFREAHFHKDQLK